MTTTKTTTRHPRAHLPAATSPLLLLLVLLLAAAAARAADAAARPVPASAASSANKHDDDDDKPEPSPAPSPDDDDPIAQMKACHAERGKGRDACLSVPGKHCLYCKSGSALPLPNVCVHELEAKLMPGILWECDAGGKEDEEGSPDSTSSLPSSSSNGDACDGLPEPACAASRGVCVWCVAAAVPSSCFTLDQAQKLPPGVFECGVAPSAAVF